MKNFVDKWEKSNKANTEGLPYIDDGERKLFYRFTPSKSNSVGAPLFVILHGHGTRRATHFQKEGWNVLSPVDHFGYEGKGAWWLGEDGDFFVKDLLQNLIKQIAQKYNSEKNIYIYGSSMGGYGAILHGILCSARAVYANVPQIKLLDTTYSNRMMKRYFSAIFPDVIPMENDLENFLTSHENINQLPIFYLCENVVSGKNAYENYLREHIDSFVDKCKIHQIKFHLELLPQPGHDKNYGLGEVLDKLERFTPSIVNKGDENTLRNTNQLVEREAKKMLKSKKKKLNIKDLIRFKKDLWLFKDTSNLSSLDISNNTLQMEIDLSQETDALYLEPIASATNKIYDNNGLLDVSNIRKFKVEVKADFDQTAISCFIIEFNNNGERITSKSYRLKKGKNQFIHTLKGKAESMKILFRFDNDEKDTIVLENLNFKIVTNDIKNSLETYIKNLKELDEKYALLITFKTDNINLCDSYNFKPRKDIKEFKVSLPVNWDVDPFSDNNWMFQLHALRLLDTEISEYLRNKDLSILKRIIDVMLDWKRDIIDIKQNFDFDRKKNNSSFAWHDMATGTRAPKIAIVFQEIIKLKHTHPLYQYIDEIYELVELHIKALSTQKIAPGNHAIFQIHGLMILLRLFPNDFENIHVLKKQTEKNMLEIFYGQFFKEGIHKENSANYHSFIFDTFEKILSKEIYANIEELFAILKLAKKNCAYMHFPNFESLLTGDSDYKIAKKRKEEEIKNGLTHFKESGYTYIYEGSAEPSMLFFDTAFLNRAHRHADFFNVLLYEYERSILVDAGKYSYDKNSPFRQYCISTRAHNVILIDNEDYKLDRKYFFTSKLVIKDKKENYYHLMASNYYNYFEVSHDRHIFYKPMEFLFVVDVLTSKESKNFKQIFHLHQELEMLEEGEFLKSDITDDVVMNIRMKSLEMNENKIYSNTTFSKGIEGELEGYRALGHNEIVENYVLVNEIESNHIILGSIFSFNKKRDFNLVSIDEGRLEILFDNYQEIIEG